MSKGYSGAAILSAAAIPVAGWVGVAQHSYRLAWGAIAVLMLCFVAIAGRSIVGRWSGILIDDRNVISLSRFQMTLWTVVVLSAYLMAALYNVYIGVDEPLAIGIPKELWLAMGISTTSLVGTPLLLASKKDKPADEKALERTLELERRPAGSDKVEGQVLGNIDPALARWSDMVTGDETSNGAHVDLAKVQMLFFTIAIVAAYCFALWRTFKYAQPDGITDFPVLDDSTVALLGISHAGYLVNKAVPRV
ncbi:hypothetical protein [Roseateles sp.]|uniref:hypothetical protein n=1 Tax=Roseateles sp. TaxID=1971397 RepID=UPI0025D15A48|nr:hypothetical protein [Roseateles sp.]MBV8036116.1 hypothetical protein [Roseateles sp.]